MLLVSQQEFYTVGGIFSHTSNTRRILSQRGKMDPTKG